MGHVSKSTLSKCPNFSLTIDNSNSIVPPSPQVTSLGDILDCTLSFEKHINILTQSAYFHLCTIQCLLPSLTPNSTATLLSTPSARLSMMGLTGNRRNSRGQPPNTRRSVGGGCWGEVAAWMTTSLSSSPS